MSVEFVDNSVKIKNELEDICKRWLEEASLSIKAQTVQNTAVDTGQLKGSWEHITDERTMTATIGSPLENAVWEEFGTGEYALNGNGRRGGWFYEDAEGKGHFTHGKRPRRALFKAFKFKETRCRRSLEQKLSEVGK